MMSEFSPELIDYLDGRISFEEFEKRRAERKAKEKESKKGSQEFGSGEDATCEDGEDASPSTSRAARKTRRQRTGETEEGISPSVHQAFASMLGEGGEEEDEENDDDDDDDDEDDDLNKDKDDNEGEVEGEEDAENEGITAGDVFALEMELNRENKKMMKEKRTRSKLPRALRGLMGEANIRYARGDKEDAILMCMEIIRQAPLAYEPFSTMAMIYEDQGDMEKALQFGLIAAHLNPSDCEEWVKLADMSLEQDNIKQAIICYSKAIKYDPTNVRFLWERSSLYEQVGEHKQAMDGYRRILNLLPPHDGEHFMQLSRDMAKSYYESSELMSAIGVMEEALKRHPELVSPECINMAAELYIANHQHNKALQALVKFCKIELKKEEPKTEPVEQQVENEEKMDEGEEKEEEKEKEEEEKEIEEPLGVVLEVIVPDEVPVDIRVKLMVCFIHQHVYKPLDPMLTSLMEQSPEELGDLYLDVAEAFLDEGQYNSALPLLSALVCSERYNLAVVWLRHAECLKALGHMDVAVRSYRKVVEMAPLHLEARLSLSTLQQQLGRPERALEALESMYDPETLAQDSSAAQQELKLLLHRSTLLLSQGKQADYLDTLLTMLAMLLKMAMIRARVCLISDSGHLHLTRASGRKVTDVADQETAYQDIVGKTSVLSREDWWQLLLRCVNILCDCQRFGEAELMVDTSLQYDTFYDERVKRKELGYLGLSTAFLDRNFCKAYNYIRLMLMDSVERTQLWNVFNQVTLHSQDVRHHRFCLRLMLKNPENLALCVLNGHASLVSGSFKHALGQYVQAFRMQPDHPLHSLCVGLTFFHMASQKFVIKRHSLVMQGFSFLWRYVERRGHCQESMYNLGRALHQLGLMHLAIHYYQKALSLPPPSLEGIDDDQVDLRREIAYNMSLIYQSSGNIEMARHLLYTHCTV
ncbi:general transcription factor 3C polypeptide 3 [Clupea harengus]|uniref:General transcription factor 3C polypeptide 3 n=1 Tax=Clupea harengus TaxID=7950 RepID=A0A6P3VQY8_CLUHA|nr:general transcription factor 3C polypeptide 3 [Clupea harengus]